jgi:hypothetical protein
MDGCDHTIYAPPAVDSGRSADGERRLPEVVTAGMPSGRSYGNTAFHESSDLDGDGKSRRTAPWPFLIRRLG